MLNRRSKKHAEIVDGLLLIFPALKIIEEFKIGNNQFIDIYLPAYSIGIEVDGEQHDSYQPFFHGKDEGKFVLQKFLDSKKELLCKEKNIFLYRVKYSDNRSVSDIISDILLKSRISRNEVNKC